MAKILDKSERAADRRAYRHLAVGAALSTVVTMVVKLMIKHHKDSPRT